MKLSVSSIIFDYSKSFDWQNVNQLSLVEAVWRWKKKSTICYNELTSSIQLQNTSFHVVERTRTTAKCTQIENARAKRAKLFTTICTRVLQKLVVKYANLSHSHTRLHPTYLSSLFPLENANMDGKSTFIIFGAKKKRSHILI